MTSRISLPFEPAIVVVVAELHRVHSLAPAFELDAVLIDDAAEIDDTEPYSMTDAELEAGEALDPDGYDVLPVDADLEL